MELGLDQRTHGAYVVVEVSGDVDVTSAPRLRAYLTDIIEAGRHDLVISLVGVEFLDSTGLGVLVGALRGVRRHDGRIVIVTPSESIRKVFEITGLDRVFEITGSVSDIDPTPA